MKKTRKTKNIYDSAITYENLYKMWKKIKCTCKNKKQVYYFSLNLNTNLWSIYNDLKNKKYIPDKYRTFMIFEPKPRLVMSQSIKDKIVNHFVTNYYLIPYLENKLIDSNVATRTNKGSSYAMELLKKYFNKLLIRSEEEIYCLKLDISKYFYTIDQKILVDMLQKEIKDKDVISLISLLISGTNASYINENITKYNEYYGTDIPLYKNGKGLSIGAMSSQFLAIYYLNKIDHYIKESLKCNYYIRYMDDFLILDNDKENLKKCKNLIEQEINKLNINLNHKSNIYKSSHGFSFLGFKYKVLNNKLNISFNKKTYLKIKEKLDLYEKFDFFRYKKSLASYYGYFCKVHKLDKGDFKMKQIDLYKYYKEKKSNHLIIIKDGIFYKSFFEDGIILWYLFEYKYTNDSVSFGSVPYNKVIEKLKSIDISFTVVSKEGEILSYQKDDEIYNSYNLLAYKKFQKKQSELDLIDKLRSILKNNYEKYDEINNFLSNLVEKN